MDGLVAYILARKLVAGAASGISNVVLNGNVLEFQFKDGTSASMTIPLPQDGKDGLTPTIGTNGNWYIGDVDTGISAIGVKGNDGTFIVDIEINESNHLICKLSDNTAIDAGELPNQQVNLGLATTEDIDNMFDSDKLDFNLATKTDIDGLFD